MLLKTALAWTRIRQWPRSGAFQLAAEQNDSEAQVLLAYCYELGSGVPQE